MSELAQKISEFPGGTIRWNGDLENPVWVAKDVGDVLGLTNVRKNLSRFKDYEKETIQVTDSIGRKQNMTGLNEKGLKRMVTNSRSPEAKELAEYLGLECFFPPIEADCLRIIKEACKHMKSVEQFHVSGYRIDLYFPEHRIAVECDEHGHSHYDLNNEIERQEHISKTLECEFVRFNPHKKNFNIGTVIHKILSKSGSI